MTNLEMYLREQILTKENELSKLIEHDNYFVDERIDVVQAITKELRQLYDLLFTVNENVYINRLK